MNWDERGLLLRAALPVVFCFLSLACGSNERTEVYPVRGQVFVDGRPASGAAVHFHPVNQELGTPAYATVNEDGSFELSTYDTDDGVEPGDYVVTINWRKEEKIDGDMVNGPDLLGELYSKPNRSPLKAKVIAGENKEFRYDLKAPGAADSQNQSSSRRRLNSILTMASRQSPSEIVLIVGSRSSP